ncbi:tetratricopeptide repeat protein [Rhodotorula paludigena]|uniref:tetratricopeptide repeat protein n=1 Tax=Rhodotorula paludigena TaxID=86838 RepID=UPI00317F0F4D
MADAFKTQGNAAIAEKKWFKASKLYTQAIELETDDEKLGSLYSNRSVAFLQLEQFDKALEDANNAALKRPDWSKAHARVGEVYARQQDFELAVMAYKRAVEKAEDDASRSRYRKSLEVTQTAWSKAKEHAQSRPNVYTSRTDLSEHFIVRLNMDIARGNYVLDPESPLAACVVAHRCCTTGGQSVDKQISLMPDGKNVSITNGDALAELAECLILDELSFYIVAGNDPKFPLPQKLTKMLVGEIELFKATRYFTNAVWSARDIIADLDKRIAKEGRQFVRMATASLIRSRIVSSAILNVNGDRAAAVQHLKLALGLLEEGNKKWKHEPYEDKGMTLKPTMVRGVRTLLLKNLLAAHRDAKTASAKRMFKLEDVENLAKGIIEECPESVWPRRDGSHHRVAYGMMPVWEAYSALAYCNSNRAMQPLHNVQPGQIVLADLDAARRAAEYYDKAAALQGNHHSRRFMMYFGLECWLRAGGLSVREVRRRNAEAKEVDRETSRWFGEMAADTPARQFIESQLDSITEHMRQDPRVRDTAIIKPVPTFNMRVTNPNWKPSQVAGPDFWLPLPGEVGLADCLFPSRT